MVSNLATPNVGTYNAHIVRSLDTTRKRLLEMRFADLRRGGKGKNAAIRNVSKKEKCGVAGKLHDTTILDYLYRVRLRSNYDDPKMFIFDEDTGATIIELIVDTQAFVSSVCALLEAVVHRAIDPKVRDDVFQDVDMISGLRAKDPFAI